MKTSHSLTLAFGFLTLASISMGCSAKVSSSTPNNQVPNLFGNGQVVATPSPASNTPVGQASQNAMYGINYQGGFYNISFSYAAGDEVTVTRSCVEGPEFCSEEGQLASESYTVKINDPTSIHSADFGNGETAYSTLTGDSKTLTLTTSFKDAQGNNLGSMIHQMSLSANPCSDTQSGAGMEDDFNQTSIVNENGASVTESADGCAELFQ